MKFVSSLLKRVVYPCLSGSGFFERRSRPRDLSVITYHGVLPHGYTPVDPMLDGGLVSADAFRRQLRLLKSHYNILHPEQFLSAETPGRSIPYRSVLITCDDGLMNTITEMLPILLEEQVPCLFFVTGLSSADAARMLWHEELYLMMLAAPDPGLLEEIDPDLARQESAERGDMRTFWWSLVKRLSRLPTEARDRFLDRARGQLGLREDWNLANLDDAARRRRFLVLNRTELKTLAGAEGAIGSHTLSHPMLSQMQHEDAWREIAECRRLLEETLHKPVWAFAYPFGDPASFAQREVKMAEQAGYRWGFSNHEGAFQGSSCRFTVPRVHVTATMSLSEFEAHISGFHENLRRRFVKPVAAPAAAG